MEQRGVGTFAYGLRGMIVLVYWGLCDSDDHAYDVMIMIAGYYGLYHSNGRNDI